MPRTFSANFNTQKNEVKNAAPFLTAIIRFGASLGGDLALVGRGIDILATAGNVKAPTIAGLVHYAIVNDWGTLGSGFGSQSDGTPDLIETTLRCNNYPVIDVGYRLSDRFVAEMETIPIDIFWNFIVGSTVYQADGPSGSVHAPTSYGFREVSLKVTSLMDTYLQRNVLHEIQGTALPNAPQSSKGKCFSLAIGDTTLSTAVDGARLPAVIVDEHQPPAPITMGPNTFALVACEAPLTGLIVSALGALYYQGHKIVETDFSIDTTGTSQDLPLNIGLPGGGGMIGDPLDNGFGNPAFATPVKLGKVPDISDPTQTVLQIVQPFFVKESGAQITSVNILASKRDPHQDFSSPTFQPVRPLAVMIYDEQSIRQTSSWPDKVDGDSGMAITRGTTNDVPPSYIGGADAFDPGWDQVTIDLHNWVPKRGRHYLVLQVSGSTGGGVGDPANQWYNVGANPAGPFQIDSPINVSDEALFAQGDGSLVPSGTKLAVSFNTVRFGANNSQTEQDNPNTIGSNGIFEMVLEPEAAVVLAAVTLYVKRTLPPGYLASSASPEPVEVKGDLTVSVNELDSNEHVLQSICSASFRAADLVAIITDVYQPLTQFLSSKALLLAGHKYGIRIEGQMDANGDFSGWGLQGITDATLSVGYGQVTARKAIMFMGNASQEPVVTDQAIPVRIRITLHALKFDRSIETWDGVRCWTLRPYCLLTDKRMTLDDDVISCDAHCIASFPSDVVWMLLNRAGVPDSRIDLAGTFTDSSFLYVLNNWFLRGGVCQQITYKALLARLAFESRSDIDWEFHQAQLKWLPQPGDTVTSARTVTLADMPPVSDQDSLPDFHVTRTETSAIYNVVNVAFQRMFNVGKGREAYLLGEQFVSLPSMAAHGPKANDSLFQMDFIRESTLATALGQFYVRWLAYAREKPIFTTFLHTLELMKGDVFVLDCTVDTTGEIFNGWLAQPILIRAIQHDMKARRIQYTGVVL